MSVYIVTVILIAIIGIFAQVVNDVVPIENVELSNGRLIRKNKYLIFRPFIIGILSFVGGFRYYVGSDFGAYYKMYNYKFSEIIDAFKEFDEPLLKLISYLERLIWNDGVSVIFFTMLITVILYFWGVSRYDNNKIALYALFYVFLGCWTFSFNGVRQAFAAAILFLGVSLANEKDTFVKKIIAVVIVCFVAYLSHTSALLMIPFFLLSQRKIDKTQILLLIICAIVVPYAFGSGYEFMEVEETEISDGYLSNSINPIRVAVAFVPLILLIFINDKKSFFKDECFIVNMAILHAILTLVTMNSAYLNRFTNYTVLFMVVFIVKAFERINGNSIFVIRSSAIILYFIYWTNELKTGNLLPFAWSFSHFGEF